MRILASILLFCSLAYAEPDPGTVNLSIQAGSDFFKYFRLWTCSQLSVDGTRCTGTKTAADLTGYSFKAQFKSNYTSTATIFSTFSSTQLSDGVVKISTSATTTTALSGKNGYWDLLMLLPDGSKQYLIKGTCSVIPTITKP